MKILGEVFKYTKPYKAKLFQVNILMGISMILSIVHPLLFGKFIDSITVKDLNSAFIIIVFMAFLFLFNLFFKVIQKYYLTKFACYLQMDIKLKIIKRIMAMDMDEYQLKAKGELMNKIENDTKAFSEVVSEFLNIVVDFISIIIVLVILINLNFILASILFIACPLALIIFKYYGRKIRMMDTAIKEDLDSYLTYLGELLSSFKLFKIFNTETNAIDNYQKKITLLYKNTLDKMRLSIKSASIIELINFTSYLIILIIGAYFIYKGSLTLGVLIAFTTYANNFSQSFLRFSQLNSFLQEAIVSVNRVKNLMQDNKYHLKKLEVPDYVNSSHHFRKDKIVLRNVSFTYTNALSPVLENINLQIPLKKIVLIKGESGSGKSTLLNILSRLYINYQGEIFLSNQNIRYIPIDVYRKRVCLVTQEHFIMTGTIRENLLLAKPNATDEELIQICKMVNIYSYIETLDYKFETLIGHNGLELSTGQQQRLSIARSLLRDADIYLFDEITSALDKDNQINIETLLLYLNKEKQKTVILVTHHPVLISEADKIFEVDKHQVNERDSLVVTSS